jgi:hypothetical protein
MKSGPVLKQRTRSPRRRCRRASAAVSEVLPCPEAGAAINRAGQRADEESWLSMAGAPMNGANYTFRRRQAASFYRRAAFALHCGAMSSDETTANWRDDIDSLTFRPARHEGRCDVHRLAFRTLLGFDATPQACIDYFHARRTAFETAATDKITRRSMSPDANFHLNSRDVGRLVKTGDNTASNSPPLQR